MRLTTEPPRFFLERVEALAADIVPGCRGQLDELLVRMDERVYLQVQATCWNADEWEWRPMRGRKWYLSPHMTDGEIVQTALKACLAFAEHEVREGFLFRGRRIFGPHISLDALLEVADRTEHRS